MHNTIYNKIYNIKCNCRMSSQVDLFKILRRIYMFSLIKTYRWIFLTSFLSTHFHTDICINWILWFILKLICFIFSQNNCKISIKNIFFENNSLETELQEEDNVLIFRLLKLMLNKNAWWNFIFLNIGRKNEDL